MKAVVLQCGSKSYADCTDCSAKAKYDQDLYQANSTYNNALAQLQEALAGVTLAESKRDAAQDQLLRRRNELGDLRSQKIKVVQALAALTSSAPVDDEELSKLGFIKRDLVKERGRLQLLAAGQGIDLGDGISLEVLKAPRPIGVRVSCSTDDVWIVYTNESGKQTGPVHLSSKVDETVYTPSFFAGNGVQPGGAIAAVLTTRPVVDVVAFNEKGKLVLGGSGLSGRSYTVGLSPDTVLPYPWANEARYWQYDLAPGSIDKKSMWILDVECMQQPASRP